MGGAWTVYRFKGGAWQERWGWCFWGGGVDTPIHSMDVLREIEPEPPTKFSRKDGSLTGPQLLEGVGGKEWGDF